MTAPFPLIDLSGPPEARGRAHGAAVTDRGRESLAHDGAQLAAGGLSAPRIRVRAMELPALIERFEPAE